MKTDEAVIFDFNGTIFWDTLYHREAWGRMSILLRDKPLSLAESHYLDGRTNLQTLEYLLGRPVESPELVRLSNQKERMYEEVCLSHSPLSLAPGFLELLAQAKASKRKVAIATSAGKDNIERYKTWFSLTELIHEQHIIYDDGTVRGKPYPDLYVKACSSLGCDPHTCTVFEDTKAGILAAQAAGIGCIIAVASPGSDKKTIQAMEGVHGLVNDFYEFSLE